MKLKLLIALLIVQMGFSQDRTCGMEQKMEQIMNDPIARQNYLNLQAKFEIELAKLQRNSNTTASTNATIIIPVAVHFPDATAPTACLRALAQTQVDILNLDYNGLNQDISQWTNASSNYPGVNTGSLDVRFVLANQNHPGGSNLVNGDLAVTFGTNFLGSADSDGNWSGYMNLVCRNAGQNLLGYSPLGGSPSNGQTVVISNSAFGKGAGCPGFVPRSPYNLGRTLTHELGHFFNLNHTFDGCGTNCNISGDKVCDTPASNQEQYGCPSPGSINGCVSGQKVLTMNYMDYTDDACMYMFSAGQKARAQALFATGGSRVGLLTSIGCQAPNVGTTCNVPASLSATGVTSSAATLNWGAATGAASYSLQYRLSSATTFTTVTTTSTSFALSGLVASSAYTYQVASICASGTSAYSTAATFTTSAVATTCTDTWEANNSISAAKTITVATNIQGLINTSTDKDYFKFVNTTAARNVKVTLTNLAADYDLRLYRGTTTQVGISQLSGTSSESIIYNNTQAVATYYAYVYGYTGAFNASSCYTLRAEIGSTTFVRNSGETEADESLVIEGGLSIYPNPTNGSLNIRLQPEGDLPQTISVYNQMGQLVEAYEVNFTKNQPAVEIRMNDLSDGIYFVQVYDGENIQTRKVLLRK